jgi:hypothetical protein
MDAIRVARAATGRDSVCKIEGSYHGHHDAVMFSVVPSMAQLEGHDQGGTIPFSGGIPKHTADDLDVRIESPASQQKLKLRTQLVSGEFFPLLGLRPAIGRVFTPEEDRVRGANPVAVISHTFWQRQFAGDPSALGTTLLVGRTGFRIL